MLAVSSARKSAGKNVFPFFWQEKRCGGQSPGFKDYYSCFFSRS